ncbi:tRNA (guanosine(46)-N7)-methyltransferase TrmB [Spiroplasma endosymbiont of Anurida maritima]|uniref:tRNA (guanosine(46)-N7)-methyltransferase TrmB n=1 Tax=Spiroplasma endosymbiont of Anurida maritima TaxID=2967972 RepID=UPI0036D23E01
MRLKYNKNALSSLLDDKVYFVDHNKLDGKKDNNLFPKKQKTFLEIGCGKGDFIINLAQQNPQNNYIAVEKYPTVLFYVLKKVKDMNLSNLKLMSFDAKDLLEIFAPDTFDGIYLNFSDPWPKFRHEKRRLTYKSFLEIYKTILKSSGFIQQKTDNDNLYLYSITSFVDNKWNIVKESRDLYKNLELLKNNVPTEYEKKWHNLGKNINYLLATFPNNEKG